MNDDKSYSQMRKDFQNIFFKKIKPILVDFEKDYKNDRYGIFINNLISCMRIAVFAFFFFFFAVMGTMIVLFVLYEHTIIIKHMLNGIYVVILMTVLCTVLFFLLICKCQKKGIESTMKEQCMSYFCEAIGNIKWVPKTSLFDIVMQVYTNKQNLETIIENNKKIDIDVDKVFVKSNLIPNYDIAIPDDIFDGVYQGVKYNVLEAKFCNYNDLENKETADYFAALGIAFDITTLFSGIIIKLDMNKNFHGNTLIFPDSVSHNSPSSNLRHTVLEDVKFEKKFDVFTDDEVEARYLITPSFMERLNCIKLAFNADNISCAFYNQCLLIGIRTTKDLFSIGNLTKSLDDNESFFIMFEEILSIIQLIEYFRLNQKIGL